MFDLGIDTKLRGCDIVKIKIGDLVSDRQVRSRAIVVQQTGHGWPRRPIDGPGLQADLIDVHLTSPFGFGRCAGGCRPGALRKAGPLATSSPGDAAC